MSTSDRGRMRSHALLGLAVLVTVADAVTWVLAEITCGLADNYSPGEIEKLCGGDGTLGRTHLALVATVLVPISYVVARLSGRVWIFAVGATAGVLACLGVLTWRLF